MRKRLVTLGMAGLMTAMSVVPAFAATEDLTANDGDNKTAFEALDYNADSAEGVDYWKALDGTFAEQDNARATEVGVQQGMSYMVTIPSFISLDGAKAAVNGNKADFNVTVTGDIGGTSEITVKPDLSAVPVGIASGATYVAFDENGDKTGTFPLKEDAQIKKDLVATITLADVDWNVVSDPLDTDGVQSLSGVHAGSVSVDKLSAGTFRNTINFDVSFTNDRDTTKDITVEP